MPTRIDARATLALGATVICWASVPVLLRSLRHDLDAWTANGIRYPLSALLYWPILALAWRSGRLDRGLFVRALVPAGLTFCGQILWALCPYYLDATMIGFLIQSALAWSLLGAMILFRDERVLLRSPAFYAGILLAAVGFVALSISRGVGGAAPSAEGVAIVLACAFFFGLYAVSVKRFMRKDSPILAFGVVAQYVSIGTVTLMLVQGDPGVVTTLSGQAWAALVSSSILGIGLAHVFLYTSIQRIGASITNGTCLVIPFVTLAIAAAALGEQLTAFQAAAGSAMVAGGGVLLLSQRRIAAGVMPPAAAPRTPAPEPPPPSRSW